MSNVLSNAIGSSCNTSTTGSDTLVGSGVGVLVGAGSGSGVLVGAVVEVGRGEPVAKGGGSSSERLVGAGVGARVLAGTDAWLGIGVAGAIGPEFKAGGGASVGVTGDPDAELSAFRGHGYCVALWGCNLR